MRIISYPSLFFLFCCLSSCASKPSPISVSPGPLQIEVVTESPIEYADQRLRMSGISEDFILLIHRKYLTPKSNWEASAKKIIESNVFGFLLRPNYNAHDTPDARKKINIYLRKHKGSFEYVKKRYEVDPKAIASLLWVETRFGKNMGSFDLPFVYYALVLGAHPVFAKAMLAVLPSKSHLDRMKEYTIPMAEVKVYERCKSKALWSLEQLKGVQEIKERGIFNPFKTRASFAGAFGIAQFIPSTYLKYSRSEFRAKSNLFKDSDAITSVANYLKESGWAENNQEAKSTALYSYNHSKDYGAVILKLASELP